MATKTSSAEGILLIAENRRARFDFTISDTYECGIVLTGTEVKSLRARHINFSDSYGLLKNNELFLIGLRLEPYSHGTHANHVSDRTRKLLLHRKELKKIFRETKERGLTVVPLKIYFKNGKAKVLVGIAKGKTKSDKRDTLKERDMKKDVARVMKRG